MIAEEAIDQLVARPVLPDTARRSAELGGVPSVRGLYAWWTTTPNALPGVPAVAVEGRDEWLLYIGIVPREPSPGVEPRATRHLRQRLISEHLGAQLGGSTFRLTLAALLWQQQGWAPLPASGRKPKLSPTDRARLGAWQQAHLRVSWVEHESPWEVESRAIAQLTPPFNLAENDDHPFHATLSLARKTLRDRAHRV